MSGQKEGQKKAPWTGRRVLWTIVGILTLLAGLAMPTLVGFHIVKLLASNGPIDALAAVAYVIGNIAAFVASGYAFYKADLWLGGGKGKVAPASKVSGEVDSDAIEENPEVYVHLKSQSSIAAVAQGFQKDKEAREERERQKAKEKAEDKNTTTPDLYRTSLPSPKDVQAAQQREQEAEALKSITIPISQNLSALPSTDQIRATNEESSRNTGRSLSTLSKMRTELKTEPAKPLGEQIALLRPQGQMYGNLSVPFQGREMALIDIIRVGIEIRLDDTIHPNPKVTIEGGNGAYILTIHKTQLSDLMELDQSLGHRISPFIVSAVSSSSKPEKKEEKEGDFLIQQTALLKKVGFDAEQQGSKGAQAKLRREIKRDLETLVENRPDKWYATRLEIAKGLLGVNTHYAELEDEEDNLTPDSPERRLQEASNNIQATFQDKRDDLQIKQQGVDILTALVDENMASADGQDLTQDIQKYQRAQEAAYLLARVYGHNDTATTGHDRHPQIENFIGKDKGKAAHYWEIATSSRVELARKRRSKKEEKVGDEPAPTSQQIPTPK